MAKGKNFYGTNVTSLIQQACREMDVSQEELDIEVLETGSAGIFGLCKKKAHIRVTRKKESGTAVPEPPVAEKKEKTKKGRQRKKQPAKPAVPEQKLPPEAQEPQNAPSEGEQSGGKKVVAEKSVEPEQEKPSAEVLETIGENLREMLSLMGFPATVQVEAESSGVQCRINSEDEDELVGTDGRILDNLQYLLRKMMSRNLPDRMTITLDAGDFRERRAKDLQERALVLAEQVKADGKTQAIAALNPSERRVVHIALQEDKGIRSRSVGEGLFKKVLIYKPGKERKSSPRKRRGGQGDRSSDN